MIEMPSGDRHGVRWIRILAIAVSAVVLASCRSLAPTAHLATDAVVTTPKVAARAPAPVVRHTVGPAAGGAGAAAGEDHLAPLGPTLRRTAGAKPCPP
ncbi:MAG: hypothetical protein ACK6CT_03265, partial [Planctomycetia bacterium]